MYNYSLQYLLQQDGWYVTRLREEDTDGRYECDSIACYTLPAYTVTHI